MSRVHPGKRKHKFDAPGYNKGVMDDDSEQRAITAAKTAKNKNYIEYRGVLLVRCGGKWVHWENADPALSWFFVQ